MRYQGDGYFWVAVGRSSLRTHGTTGGLGFHLPGEQVRLYDRNLRQGLYLVTRDFVHERSLDMPKQEGGLLMLTRSYFAPRTEMVA